MPLKAIRFLAVFVAVSAIVTVAAITATFMIWSFLSVRPGTVTALTMLFLIAPGTGIAAGIAMAVKAVRQPPQIGASGPVSDAALPVLMRAGLAAIVGGLAGYGACLAAIDLTYTDRWSNPGSAPSWLPAAPFLAAAILALLLALLVLGYGSRSRGRPVS